MNLPLLACIAVGLSLVMAGAWMLQRRTGQSGWIDTIWSLAVGAGGIIAALLAEGLAERRIAVALVVIAWALRLGLHIGGRTRAGGEDPRYEALIEEWGKAAGRRLFLFLQVQALAAFVLVLAVHLAAIHPAPALRAIDGIALIVALIAIGGEALADRQLAQFRASGAARSSLCETGLWAYSRHPNYFFEWLFWCAFPLAALSSDPWSVASLLAPLQMYWLLVHVSGIPPLERHMLASRGEAFRALQRRVNAFFPGPRKQG